MHSKRLDNKASVPLPEGVSIDIVPAGIVVRSCAYGVDLLIRGLIIGLGSIALSFLGGSGVGLILVLSFFVSWFYYIVYESRRGQTPGKKLFKLVVVDDNGLRVSTSKVIIRNLIRPVDALPLGYVAGLLSIFASAEYKRLGDWAAGTHVVYLEEKTLFNMPEVEQSRVPKRRLTTDEQRIVMLFSERSQSLSTSRQQELAAIVSETFNLEGENAVMALHEISRYYMGESA